MAGAAAAKAAKAATRSEAQDGAGVEQEEGGSYAQHYIDTMRTLPLDVRRTLKELAELEKQSVMSAEALERDAQALLQGMDAADGELDAALEDRRRAIHVAYEKALAAAEEKVAVAQRLHELTSSHLHRLDGDIERIEQARRDMAESYEAFQKANKRTLSMKKPEGNKRSRRTDEAADALPPDELAPTNPTEETYCLCNRVSFGQMVACDGPKCPIEWFHYECVGLTEAPPGKWFCQTCRPKQRKSGAR